MNWLWKIKIGSAGREKGLTLLELIISVGVFSIVVLVGTAAFISVLNSARKAQAFQSVMHSFDAVLEEMSRNIRTGTAYHCGDDSVVPYNKVRDCDNGDDYFAYESGIGDPNDSSDQVVYRFIGSRMEQSVDGGAPSTFFSVTPPNVVIEDATFYVKGSLCEPVSGHPECGAAGDDIQPHVVFVLTGYVETKSLKTPFVLQTTFTQRRLDIE